MVSHWLFVACFGVGWLSAGSKERCCDEKKCLVRYAEQILERQRERERERERQTDGDIERDRELL